MGKYLVNRLNIKGIETTEKAKLDKINWFVMEEFPPWRWT